MASIAVNLQIERSPDLKLNKVSLIAEAFLSG